MNYPDYDSKELIFAERDGNYPISEFSNFVSDLIDRDIIDNSTERGILAFVKSKGTSGLSEKQSKVLEKIVARYSNEECRICGDTIPFSEVLDLDENDGLCSYHKHQLDKDND